MVQAYRERPGQANANSTKCGAERKPRTMSGASSENLPMIDLHYWPTPNGWKISILLEECALPYRLRPVNIGRGEQFAPEFLRISPNNRMPAIVDHDPVDGGEPVALFESGAILIYLAEKTGRFLPEALRERHACLQWLMWQMGGLGPMAGQNGHFLLYAPQKIPYAIERYGKEVDRLYGVLDTQLGRTGRHVAGSEYSIADIAIFPWVRTHKAQQVDLDRFPNVRRWYEDLFKRPAVQRGLALGRELRAAGLTDEARRNLFGQTAQTLRDAADGSRP
jgi:GSH-dependent disulfide-bond oxidoreductase